MLPLLLILFVHLFLLVNTRFTLWPEMVVYPYLLNNGFSLYKDIINPYMPFLTGFLAIFAKIFGYSPTPYKIFTWILILTIDLLVYFIAKKTLGGLKNAYFALIFFVILSVPLGINGLWFDLVQTPFILLSFCFFFRYFESNQSNRNLLWSSLFLAAAFSIKQQALLLLLWFIIVIIFKNKNKKFSRSFSEILVLIIPLLIVIFSTGIVFLTKGYLKDFLFWTIYFPFINASRMPGYLLLPTIRQLLLIFTFMLMLYPSLIRKGKGSFLKAASAIVLIFFAYPRFDYFHLIPALTIISLSAGDNFYYFFKKNLISKFLLVLLFASVSVLSTKYFLRNWTSEVRFFEREILQSATFLKIVTDYHQKIYILNGPDQLFPLSDTLPTKPWADEFPWYLELSNMQQKVVEGLNLEDPKFVVFKPYEKGNEFEIGSYRPRLILDYIDKNYTDFIQISDSLWLKNKK